MGELACDLNNVLKSRLHQFILYNETARSCFFLTACSNLYAHIEVYAVIHMSLCTEVFFVFKAESSAAHHHYGFIHDSDIDTRQRK